MQFPLTTAPVFVTTAHTIFFSVGIDFEVFEGYGHKGVELLQQGVIQDPVC